ncbi:MAG: type IVB secretion system protein IcmH/DotU, partial [Rhodospirillales bacterium]|nr:type IVB secretion system protein IcmH/DotU [Rhodospirillales bacterium]
GYPPQQPGYPPQQAAGYPPQQQAPYPPQAPGEQPPGYPPQQGYPPQDPMAQTTPAGYPPQQGAYPPPGGYPQQQPPGPGRLAAAVAGRPVGAPIDNADMARGTGSPVAAAAVPLLGLAARLRAMTGQVDVNVVRESVYQDLHGFAKAGREAGVQPEILRASHYALAATIDDVVMNTPWGAHSGWNKRTMVSAFHGDVEGGERFYAYLERMMQAPTANRPALQLMYDCMSLGFLGRYRLRQRGPAEHDMVREKVWQTLRTLAGPLERELSPDWRGVDAPAKANERRIPAWLVATLAALLAFLLFGAFLIALSSKSESAEGRFKALLTQVGVRLPVPKGPDVPPPPVVEEAKPPPEHFAIFLEPEIKAGKVTVDTKGRAMRITINFRAMFPSGESTPSAELEQLLVRIGQELKTKQGQGQVLVVGHTDSDPIRTLRFPSNQVLSQSRAENATAIMVKAAGASERERFKVLGKADTEPAADNKTEEGKSRNRRIEVLLFRPDPAEAQ